MKRLLLSFFMLVSVSIMWAQHRDVILPERPKTPLYKDYDSENASSLWFSVETQGVSSIMEKSKNMQAVDVTVTGGYRQSEYLRIGVGIGSRMYVNNYDVRDSDSKFGFPIFVNARGNFISSYDRDGVPYWSINMGGITNEGVLINPTIGYSFGGLRNNLLIGLSYSLNSFKSNSKKNEVYSYLGVKVGYEF